jgi:chromosome segregation ATPase
MDAELKDQSFINLSSNNPFLGSYQNALSVLKEFEVAITEKSMAPKSGLVFPYDAMNHAHNTMFDTWRVVMGLGTQAEAKLVKQNEDEKQQVSREDAIYQKTIKTLKKKIIENRSQFETHDAELDKAVKAKQAAQRNARKQKVEIEESAKKVLQLNSELSDSLTHGTELEKVNSALQAQVTTLTESLNHAQNTEQQQSEEIIRLQALCDALKKENV